MGTKFKVSNKFGLMDEFAESFGKSPHRNMESMIMNIGVQFDKEVCEFATQRKTKIVYYTKNYHFCENKFLCDYKFFDESEKQKAEALAKSTSTTVEKFDFTPVLDMTDEEFEQVVCRMHNAETARNYRKTMLQKDGVVNEPQN